MVHQENSAARKQSFSRRLPIRVHNDATVLRVPENRTSQYFNNNNPAKLSNLFFLCSEVLADSPTLLWSRIDRPIELAQVDVLDRTFSDIPHRFKNMAPQAGQTKTKTVSAGFNLPPAYSLFFLVIEPISALVGAFFAHFKPEVYLELTHAATAPSTLPLGTGIAMSQLANLYLFFALNEAIVLRATADLKVWSAVLFVLLVADLGHLYTVRALGPGIYYNVAGWNAIDWGNVPFVYFGAIMSIAFLSGIGLGNKAVPTKKQK
ncbi:hypothetical protein VDGD_09742 [Verticillium dahliae]|nr:Protein IMPACT-like protein [Verticillium dahliae VDG1]RBQ70278.1 hypothetical protein VDGD_09742 [Verticillium dahliae]